MAEILSILASLTSTPAIGVAVSLLFTVPDSETLCALTKNAVQNTADGELLKLYCIGLHNTTQDTLIFNAWPLGVLTVVIGLISLVTIIVFQRRILQMRFCVYNILLSLAQFILLLFYF